MSRDLFGQVQVTWPEVNLWLRLVAHIDPESPRAAAYIELWRVPDKVAAAKLAGTWPPTKSSAPPARWPAGSPRNSGL